MSEEATPVENTEEEAPKGLPEIAFDDFIKVDLRVATVTEAEFHPNADRLLKLQLDVGELGPRQICAGIRGHYEPEDMKGKQIIIVANLAPRKIRGEVSQGMLLAASVEEAEEKSLALLGPDNPLPAGATVG